LPLRVVVLYLEDDDDFRFIQATALRAEGFVVHEARTIAEARALLATADPDLVLTDRTLPDGDAWRDFVPRVRAHQGERHIPVITMSGDASPAAATLAVHAGCDVFLPKPGSLDVLLAHMGQLTARRSRGAVDTD